MAWPRWKNAKPNYATTNHNIYNERNKKKGRPCKRRRYEVKKNLNITGIKIKQAMARHRQEWRKTLLEVTYHSGLWCSRKIRRNQQRHQSLNCLAETADISELKLNETRCYKMLTMTFLPGPILRTVTPSHCPSFISSSPGGIRFSESTAVISTISNIKYLQFQPQTVRQTDCKPRLSI